MEVWDGGLGSLTGESTISMEIVLGFLTEEKVDVFDPCVVDLLDCSRQEPGTFYLLAI